MSPAIPIVDFSPYLSSTANPSDRAAVAQKLVTACRDTGFVYITNHGIPQSLVDETFSWSRKFFDLNQEEKMKAPHPPGYAVHRGYSWPGLEKVSQVITSHRSSDDPDIQNKLRQVGDCKESFEVGSEESKEQPNIWIPEDTLPGFRKFTTEFYWTCNKLAVELIRALSLGLGLPDNDYLMQFHSGHNNQLRLLHYPPIPAASLEDQSAARMPAHTDWGTITFLFQDECGGLEVQTADGDYVQAEPVEGAIVMNIGDCLMRWSNDKLKSNMHRVTLPPAEDRYTGKDRMTRARYSIPYFVVPDETAPIKTLEECITQAKPAHYAPLESYGDYRILRGSVQYESKRPEPNSIAAAA
ncbi:Clavaminate synthase-like protein [Rhizodiscina lignyota]|uniref:Clavaminate synthase-like protein n=1 Tax=Rhizodiscina lignyota TaxID=1504668 RepID=A0A9P4IHD8_9PEZI|nr:Clavaminate synthase-like protein [Rhizodiscina lignyota]